jgi:hypothetical protein
MTEEEKSLVEIEESLRVLYSILRTLDPNCSKLPENQNVIPIKNTDKIDRI